MPVSILRSLKRKRGRDCAESTHRTGRAAPAPSTSRRVVCSVASRLGRGRRRRGECGRGRLPGGGRRDPAAAGGGEPRADQGQRRYVHGRPGREPVDQPAGPPEDDRRFRDGRVGAAAAQLGACGRPGAGPANRGGAWRKEGAPPPLGGQSACTVSTAPDDANTVFGASFGGGPKCSTQLQESDDAWRALAANTKPTWTNLKPCLDQNGRPPWVITHPSFDASGNKINETFEVYFGD